jgi:hypothetical protein
MRERRLPAGAAVLIRFIDRETTSDAWIGVRVRGDAIGLAASLGTNGDVEVFFGRDEAEALREALARAIRSLR